MTADHSRRARGFLWNRKRLIIVGLVTVAIAFVPMFPHSPDCLESSTPTSLGSIFLADDYQKGLIAHLASYDVPYISVGNVVLLRLWTRLADPESWVLNASNKTVMLLAQGRYHGIEKPVPLRIKEMVEKRRDPDGFIDLDCPLVRAVAIDGW